MPDRDAVEELRVKVRDRQEEAEALARRGMDQLARLSSGLVPLEELDPGKIRAAADDLADQVARYQTARQVADDLRRLLL